MNKNRLYTCEKCGNKMDTNGPDSSIVFCCGEPMVEELPVCTVSNTAEHTRFDQLDEPCDDGRAG